MNFPSKTLALIVSVGLSAGAISTAAFAGDVGEMTVDENGLRSIAVYYDDLNLDSESGMDTLDRRIHQAAKEVCGVSLGKVPVSELVETRACTASAIDQAAEGIQGRGKVILLTRAAPKSRANLAK